MKTLESALKVIWKSEIAERFRKGLLTYERQLQAELYHQLKSKLSAGYEIWIEPVIYLRDCLILN